MPANFGQLQDQIDEMYEEKSEDVKKMYSPQDFTEEIHKSIMRTLKKSGINPTKEAIQDVLIGIKQLSAYYDLSQEGAIEAISISAVGMIKDLKYSPVKKSSPVQTVAEIAILAKVAEVLVNKDGTLNLGAVNSMIDNYPTLSHAGKMQLLDCYSIMPTDLLDKLCAAIDKDIDSSPNIPKEKKPEYKQAVGLMKYFTGVSNGEIEVDPKDVLEIVTGGSRDSSNDEILETVSDSDKEGSRDEISEMFSGAYRLLKKKGIADDKDIATALAGAASQVFKNELGEANCYIDGYDPPKSYEKRLFFGNFDLRCKDGTRIGIGDLEQDEDFNRLLSGSFKAKDLSAYRDVIGQALQNRESDLARAGGDTERIGRIIADIKRYRTEAERISAQRLSQKVDASKMEYGMNSVISSLSKETDVETIEAALKLLLQKTKEISKDPKQVELVKNGKSTEVKAWLKERKQEIDEDKAIPDDVKDLYAKLLKMSLLKKGKEIMKDDESLSEYLKYISQPELAQMIKKGIEDKAKQVEVEGAEQPKEENTPTQPQKAPVPIENAMMNTFMDLFGGPVNGNEISTVYLGGRESLINEEKENILKVNSMENYLGKVAEGGPVTYDDIKDRFEKRDILHDFETAEPLEYNEPPAEAVNELLVGPRGKKLVKNPEEMIQEEVNPMEEVTPNEPDISIEEDAPKGPATINEPETQGVEDAKKPEEIIQEEVNPMEEVAPNEPDISNEGEAPKGPEEGISAPEEPAEINEPETQGVEDAFETAPSENGDIGIDETIPEVEEPAEEVMQEDIGEMVQEVGETTEEPQFEEADIVEEAPVPAVISDRQGQLKKISENVPMRAVREMMDHIKQKMIELKDKITGKNKNPEDRENNDDDFTQ